MPIASDRIGLRPPSYEATLASLVAPGPSRYRTDYYPELRGLSELLDAEYLLEQKVRFDHHSMLRSRVESGNIQIIPREQYNTEGYRRDTIVDDIWQGALAAATATENEVGKDQLGPWTDYERGMLQGKLSALRWVLGDEWDMLDT